MKYKTKFSKLEKHKSLFLQIGLIISLSIVLLAFEWRTSKDYSTDLDSLLLRPVIDDELPEITYRKEDVKPPIPKAQELNIVDDQEEVDDEVDIDIEIGENDKNDIYYPPIEEDDIEESPVLDDYITVPEINPEFPGGIAKFYEYLQKNIEYPYEARVANVSGKVYVSFIVEKDGSITNISIDRGLGAGCDEETVRVLRKMPKWKPGIQMNFPVRVQMRAAIDFYLK